MKYLFVDTNNFIPCALLTEPGHSPVTIDRLIDSLSSDEVKLIFPEIVELEFFRKVDSLLSIIEKQVMDLEKAVNEKYPNHLKGDKERIVKSIKEIYRKRKFASKLAKIKVKKLFKSKNVIRIPVTYEMFINSYKRVLAGKKPSKSEYCSECGRLTSIIDNDCLIFESILSLNNDLKDNELIFCSANIRDFADKIQKRKYDLHPELRADLPKNLNVRYYLYLGNALNREFSAKIERIELDKIRKYHEYVNKTIFQLQDHKLQNVSQVLAGAVQQEALKAQDALGKIASSMSTAAERARLFQPSFSDSLRHIHYPTPTFADILETISSQKDEEASEPEKEEGNNKAKKKEK